MKIKTRDVIICGFALFAIFFGAGNIIFPPNLGVIAGENWLEAMLGFILSDPFLPVLGVLVTSSLGGRAVDLGKRVGHKFSVTIAAIAILLIGPLFAVPRTGATTHEILVLPQFPQVPAFVTSIIFFGLTLYIVLNAAKVLDIIGKYLTPALLILLLVIVIKSIVSPPGEFAPPEQDALFRLGFLEGYQTMDALGASLMSGLVLSDLIRRGYDDRKTQIKASVYIGLVAFVLLALVYGGMTYAGATVSTFYEGAQDRVFILLGTVDHLLGKSGTLLIGIAVSLACLTTSTGLISTCGNFFESASEGKLPYKKVVTVATLVAFLISLVGVEGILQLAGPVLSAIYPIVIALILFSIFDRKIKYDYTFVGAVIGAGFIGVGQSIFNISKIFGGNFFRGFYDWTMNLPLHSFGFEWLLPSLVVAAIFTVYSALTGRGGKAEQPIR